MDPETNTEVIPSTENGWKFELILYSLVSHVELGRLGLFTVDRTKEFAPVKDADCNDGAIHPDTPSMARQMVLAQHTSWLKAACPDYDLRVDPESKGNIEVSMLLSYAGENLEQLLRGDNNDQFIGSAGYINHEGQYFAFNELVDQ